MLYIIGLIGGFILSNQNPINAKLGATLKSPFRSSFTSFSIGTIFLVFLFFITNQHTASFSSIAVKNPWWIWIGGILGAIYLTSNVLLFPKLGAIQTIILPILGQVLMGEVIDTFGLFGTAKVSLTLLKIVGIVTLLIGIYVAIVLANKKEAIAEELKDENEKHSELNGWRVWAIIAGGFSSMQQAINGHLGSLLGSAIASSGVSFLVGTIVILMVVLIKEKRIIPREFSFKENPKWIFIGGILGSTYVFIVSYLVPQLGAGLTITLSLFGSIIGSIVIQQFGWWKSLQANVKRAQIIGIIIMAVGVVMIKFG
jgi:transporter family-2 protein